MFGAYCFYFAELCQEMTSSNTTAHGVPSLMENDIGNMLDSYIRDNLMSPEDEVIFRAEFNNFMAELFEEKKRNYIRRQLKRLRQLPPVPMTIWKY